MKAQSIALLGASGQLGKTVNAYYEEIGFQSNTPLRAYSHSDIDISQAPSVNAGLAVQEPTIVINAAAYTAVDKAESASEAALVHSVNEVGPRVIAEWCARHGALLIHISTDFVFDGENRAPYLPSAETRPQSVYGKSKLAGENALLETKGLEAIIVRTSWLYSRYGSNFVKTMLRLMIERPELAVVADQVGSPTSTESLCGLFDAVVSKRLRNSGRPTIDPSVSCLHWCDSGAISWYEFAVEIQRLAVKHGLLEKPIPIKPIATAEYPTPATRPAYSALDTSGASRLFQVEPQPWNRALENVIEQLTEPSSSKQQQR